MNCLLNFQSEYACVTRTCIGNQNLTSTPGALFLSIHSLCASRYADIWHQRWFCSFWASDWWNDLRWTLVCLAPLAEHCISETQAVAVVLLAVCSTVSSCPTVCFSTQLLMDIGVASHSGLSWIVLLWTSLWKHLCVWKKMCLSCHLSPLQYGFLQGVF